MKRLALRARTFCAAEDGLTGVDCAVGLMVMAVLGLIALSAYRSMPSTSIEPGG